MRAYQPNKVPLPPDFRPLGLDPEQPVDVEIGCGVGFHPLHYARAHPGRQVVAFERTSEKFAKFRFRLAHHEPLPNLTAIHGDGIAWVTHSFGANSVDRYFLLYPNPYPKESQRNLRFHEMPFFAHLCATLKPGGTVTLATNEAFYAEEAEARILEHWGLRLLKKEVLAAGVAPRTHFEKKYLERGQICWDLIFQKPLETKKPQ